MQIRHVKIENFRGIRRCEWTVASSFICLVGPGDSTKSTILDAIELALSPRWTATFDDSDFFGCNTAEPISIEVTVGQVPATLLRDSKFGLHCRGWNPQGGLREQPLEDGDELVLTVRLKVDQSLEPSWAVISDRTEDGTAISAKDRERLGMGRLGSLIDRHLGWSQGSALARMTAQGDQQPSNLVFAEIGRTARKSLMPDKVPTLKRAAEKAMKLGRVMGVAPKGEYEPRLDAQNLAFGVAGLTLHDGDIPVRRAGFGTRRLLTLALQRDAVQDGGITLIDEIETGLEPHRLRGLLKVIRPGDVGQVIITSHSADVIRELRAEEVHVVRCEDGTTTVTQVPSDLQGSIRLVPEALLGRKVLVCEGKTELGFARYFSEWWARKCCQEFPYLGVATALGSGSSMESVALALRRLGYEVLLFGDSDRMPDVEALKAAGVKVVLWGDGIAIEQRVALDLPWRGVAAMVDLALELNDEDGVRAAIASQLGLGPDLLEGDPIGWPTMLESATSELEIRKAVGIASLAKGKNKRKPWFKDVQRGERLAAIVAEWLVEIPEWLSPPPKTDLAIKLSMVRDWTHGHESNSR